MAFIDWQENYSVGIKQFNDDHKELVKIINELHNGLVSNLGISQMTYVMDGLVNYTVGHFAREEKYMKKYDYSGYDEHKEEHEKLLNKVREYYQMLKDGRSSFTIELMAFLKDWLVDHILGSDMEYKEFFKEFAKKAD